MITYNKEDFIRLAKTDSDEFEKMLLKEFYELRTAINEAEKVRNAFKWELRKKKLQALKQGAQLWTCRNYPNIPYGSECRKVSNGSKRMRVVIASKHWMIPYSDLTETKPEKVMTDINRMFSKITI